VIVGGRRLGKSHGLAAPYLLRNVQQMPRSTGGIVMPSFQHGLTNTLPGTLSALELFGYKRDVHYFVGVRPPKTANFQRPYIEPSSFDHVISWYNGSIQILISQDRVGTSRSLTLDYLLTDESRMLNYEKLKNDTIPANCGFKGHFSHIPWHHGMLILSDMPPTQKPAWFEHYKDRMDPELISTIEGIINQIWNIRQQPANEQYLKKLKQLRRDMARFQSIHPVVQKTLKSNKNYSDLTITDRIDSIVTHKIAGPIIFFLILIRFFLTII
jgi:hypothetical protein